MTDSKLDYIRQEIWNLNEADGMDLEIMQSIDRLLANRYVEAERKESGEWYFKTTELGKQALQETLRQIQEEAGDV
ncbi:MAG: hypothetical protein ACWGQW_04145 [bacterium]|jgi:DNA-binding PadR family transcriptional regulator